MNFRFAITTAVLVGTLFSSISKADELDTRAEFFVKLYVSMCMKNLHNLETLRDQLVKSNLPKLPPEKAAHFLNGSEGDAWPVPSQGELGNFVLALPTGNNLCVVFARRANQIDIERRFEDIAGKAPSPLVVEKGIDQKLDTLPNGKTHTVSYEWSIPQASRRMMFTLSTSASENAQLQAMASAAVVNK